MARYRFLKKHLKTTARSLETEVDSTLTWVPPPLGDKTPLFEQATLSGCPATLVSIARCGQRHARHTRNCHSTVVLQPGRVTDFMRQPLSTLYRVKQGKRELQVSPPLLLTVPLPQCIFRKARRSSNGPPPMLFRILALSRLFDCPTLGLWMHFSWALRRAREGGRRLLLQGQRKHLVRSIIGGANKRQEYAKWSPRQWTC